MKRIIQKSVLAMIAVFAGSLFFVSNASASVVGNLLTGSTGTVTASLNSLIFNNDPAALPAGCTTTLGRGCNSDVTTFTNLTFIGGPLAVQEGIYINNNDLAAAPSLADQNTFLTFASHPNLVFSETAIGPGSANTNCATTNSNSSSPCSVFAGSPIILAFLNGNTVASISVVGKASDTGVGGLPTGSNYTGAFSQTITSLPNGAAPTPANVQLFFCPSGTCTAGDFTANRSITTSQSGTFTATGVTVPEPSSMMLMFIGSGLIGGYFVRRRKLSAGERKN